MNKNTNTQTDNETPHMSLQIAHFFPHFFRAGKYLLPLLVGLFILAACGGGAAPTTVEQDTTTGICETNLFDTRCNAPDVETKRAEKIEECITGNAAGTNTCRQARDANPCLKDPLAPTCTAETVDKTFVAHLETAKVERANFCRQGNNISEETELCASAVTTLCSANPFDTICFADATYQDMRIDACSGTPLPTDFATLCTTSELKDIVCLATGAKSAPFNTTICGADDGVMNAEQRQEFCRANLSNGLCTKTISTFCTIIDADKFTDALCGTPASAAMRGTYCVGLEGGSAPEACGNDTEENSLVRAYCTSGSSEALLDMVNCATTLAKTCETAPFGRFCTSDDNIRARAVMCRSNTNGSNSCDATRTVICEGGGAAITANIFDDLCDVGYDNLRTIACVSAPSVRALPSTKCGSETTKGPLFIYCRDEDDGATNSTHCPERYKASGVRAERWQTDAVDANQNDLTIVPAGGASKTDILTNFIVGGEDGLGFVADGTIITEILRQDAVRLDILDDSDDGKSGFGWASVRRGDVESSVFRDKSYIGLLSGTDVGAPIRDNTKTGVWSARMSFLSRIAAPVNATFILDVSFGPNTLKTRAGSLPIVHQDGTWTLSIDGKFTDAGVLYGTTDFYTSVGSTTSAGRGTLSGVIGVDGAVGIFASDNLETNTYTGGFVAALGCTDYPFNVGCTSDVDIIARANACRGNIMTNGVGGCDATARTICMDGTTGSGGAIAANILDPLCLSTPAFVDDIITACNDDITDTGVFAVCPAQIARLCANSGARNPVCPELAVTEGKVDFVRWARTAVDTDPKTESKPEFTITGPLTILDKITGTTDPIYSYVEGRADGLERGEYLIGEDTHEIRADQFDFHQILRLSDLVGSEDTSSGAAFRQFSVRIKNTNQNVSTHNYAGLLSGTNLGAPISDTNPTVLLWAARLQLVALAILFEADFTMEVNFGDKTIRTREDMDAPAVPRAIARTSIVLDSFSIDGKFTEDGVIYGTTELKRTRRGDELTSTGSLTGLIGERGAAGVFFSNDNQKTFAGSYVGGFVAIPTSCEFYPFGAECIEDTDIMERLEACNKDININGVGGCDATFDIVCRDGNTEAGGAIVGNPNHPLCVGNVRTGNADTALWKRDAVDTDGTLPLTPTGPLTVLTEVGAHDADENYVQAGADELNRGFLVDEEGNFIGNPGRIGGSALDLSDVGLLDDAASGVKHERYVSDLSNPFISRTTRRFYAGILSGTDLGAPLRVDNTSETIWNAKFAMVDERGRPYSGDFTLEVNFGNKSINTVNPIALAHSDITTGTLTLTGKFTTDGVIYGTSQLKLTSTNHIQRPNEELTSDGSLTGLIGEKGAVGAFISKGGVDEGGLYPDKAGRYSGGFVARNNSLCLSDTETLFDTNCYESRAIILARADMCDTNMDVNGAGGCDDTIVDVCSDTDGSGSAINPFHAICGVDATYDESRSLSCVNNRNGYIDGLDDNCALRITKVCEAANDNNPLDVICAFGNTYDVPRQAACAGETVAAPSGECAPVIAKFCTNNPFNDMASSGAEKFDCNGSETYHLTRRTACVADNQSGFPSTTYDCTDTIRQTCTTDPNGDSEFSVFSVLCKTQNQYFDEYEKARLDFCVDNLVSTSGFSDGSPVGDKCEGFIVDDCEIDPFEDKCYIIEYRDFGRFNACSSSDLETDLEGAPPANCNRPELSGKICGTVDTLGTDPFAPICAEPTAVAAGFVLLDVQHAFCRDVANINGRACADTVTNFCDVAEGRDLFDDLCNTGNRAGDYDNYRVFACQVTDANTAVNSECGTIVSTNCTGVPETDSPACMTGGTLPAASLWAYTARNADNTTRLRVLDEVGLGDADTNYVQGNATELNLGVLLEDNGTKKANASLSKGSLSITDLDNVGVELDDATGGVAFIGVAFNEFTTTNKVKYYAGLLDNIDLGAPLADSTANGIWNARFSAIVDGAVHTDIDTSIVINFDTKSLTTNDEDLVTLSNSAGSISIAGKFTDVGVIYGTSSWTSALGDKSSTGSVTGLIGAKGAIGAFVSSGESTNDEEYAGGFVAAPVAECVGAVAFTNSLCAGPVGKAGRIAYVVTCRTTDCPEFVVGNAGPTISDCTNRADGDPHQTGCESDNFDAERIARNDMCIMTYDSACEGALTSCLDTGTDSNCGQLVGAYCDANAASDNRCTDDAPAIEAIVCRDSVFDTRCDTGYDEERQTACAGEDVTSPVKTGCAEVISTLCLANPLDNAAGAGATKFDCAGSVTYTEQRHMACAGENIATLSEGDRCLPVISALCDLDPFNNVVAGLGATTFNCTAGDTFLPERVAACKNNIDVNGGAGGCDTTISNACMADAFDSFCFDRDNDGNYGVYETARISYCQARVFRTDGFTNDTPDSKICADFVSTCPATPFDDKCKIVDNYASDRLSLCEGAIDDLTAAYATPAHCNTADFSGAICGAVNRLGTNPFAPICAEPAAVAGDFVLLDVQHAFCQDGGNINGAACADTVTNFCDTASGVNLFDALCTTGDNADDYLNYRVAVCEATNDRTGVYNACTNILSMNCPTSGTRSPACTPAEGTLPTSVWLYTAPNANNTGRLEILEEVGTDDAYTNYVQGNATGLNLGVLLKENGTLREGVFGDETVLSISELDNVGVDVGDATGGVAFTGVSHNDFTVNSAGNKVRYYAGLLDNVDLGGPVPATTTNAIWNARFYVLRGLLGITGSVETDTETTLVVNFDPNTIETRDVADSVTFSNTASISIRGKFTATGVIFGTSRWTLGDKSSAGSVTGLIGAKGAIGAFVSNGDNTDGEYAGGFVAAPVDCTHQTGNPFYRLCFATDNAVRLAQEVVCDADVGRRFDPLCAPYTTPEEKTEAAETCRMEPQTTGCDRVIVEATQDTLALTINSCTHSNMGNPYQDGCADLDGFDAERTARDLSCTMNSVYDASQCSASLGTCLGSITDTGCEAFVKLVCDADNDSQCTGGVPMICGAGGTDPLSTVCETGYEVERHTTCAMQDINTPSDSRCAPIIKTLCDPDPFATAVGAGTTKINCTEADIYAEVRETDCATQDIATLMEGDKCKPVIDRLCNDDPFATAAGAGATKFNCTVGNTYQMVRDMKCTEKPAQLVCDPVTREKACARGENQSKGTQCNLIIVYRCTQEPLNNAAGAGDTKFLCTEPGTVVHSDISGVAKARVTLCKNPDNSDDPLCQIPSTLEFITTCANDPWNSVCRSFGDQYADERIGGENDRVVACRADVNRSGCDNTTVRRTLCVANEKPFAPFCGTNDGINNAAARVAFCNPIITNSEPENSDCTTFIPEYCSRVAGRNLFNAICTMGTGHEAYDLARVAACRADMTANGECGTIIATNCTDADNPSPECAIATVAVWDNYAVNKDNTARLDVLDEVGADDPTTNYVKAGANGLNLGFVEEANGNLKTGAEVSQHVLKLSRAGTTDDNQSGVSVARIDFDGFTADSAGRKERFYAGILSGTDLGGPLTDENSAVGFWPTRLYAIFGDEEFRLTNINPLAGGVLLHNGRNRNGVTVNFGNRTIESKGLGNFNLPEKSGVEQRYLELFGKFTDSGVIYGTSRIREGTVKIISDGSLTGLIGAKGAVGVFASDGVGNSGGEYIGGFVADNPNVLTDCSVTTGNPFNLDGCPNNRVSECTREPGDSTPCPNLGEVRVDLCRNRDASQASFPTSFDANRDCTTRAVLSLLCVVAPLDTLCAADDRYDDTRQLSCSGLGISNVVQLVQQQPLCTPVIQKLCTAEPFNQRAGVGGNKFDCSSARDDVVVQARITRIVLCLASETSGSLLCAQAGVPAVLATCAADPFDAVCTPFATQYSEARVDRLETCRGKASTRGDVNCASVLPTICAEGDTPFAQVCAGYDETQATITQTCATDTDPTNPLCDTVVLPVSGGDDVLVKDCIKKPYTKGCPESVFYAARAVICESEATSFRAGCLSDSNYASNYRPIDVTDDRRADLITRCTDSNTDNDEGCHTIAARTAREALITRCADKDMPRDNCDTDIGNGTTLLECINNPFLAACSGTDSALATCLKDETKDDCSGELVALAVATALADSPDAVTRRDALVARCSDSGMDRTDCNTPVGTSTIAGCTTVPFDAVSCVSGAFDDYRVVDCAVPANVFAPRCQGGIDGTVITARAELALSCAVTAGGTGCDTIVSGSLTVDMCNTNPFATGCEDAAFANIRRVKCKEGPSDDACGVKDGQRITSYVQGGATELELGDSVYKDADDLATYVKDDPKTKNINESAAFDIDGNRIIDNSATVIDESRMRIGTDFDPDMKVRRDIKQGGLTLNDLVAETGNEEHGFAFAHISGGRGADDINGWDRYYAGLLSGTDVGAALTAGAKWYGKIAIVSGLNGSILTDRANFALTIDFTDKTLTSGDIVLPKLNGLFAINGKFAGSVIYGATSLRTRQNSGELASIGSVTGLIGQKGAVGAFISSGEGALVNTFGEYAGGFVASSGAPDVIDDCTDDSNRLNAECIANDAQYYDICVTTAEINTQATTDFCAPFVQRYIARETECASAPLDDENHACAPVLAQLCDFNSGNIFKDSAGTGTTKFNCTEVTAFTATRQQICRIPAYANGGAIVNLDGAVSVTDPIPACGQIITDICAGDPFTQTVKTTLTPATNLCGSAYDDARKAICMGEVSRGMVAPQRCFDTIEQVCNADPFNEDFCLSSNFGYTATQVRLCYADMNANGECGTIIQANCPTDGGVRNVECRSARFTQWMDDYNTDNSDPAVASIPDGETKKARILLGRANGLDTETNVTSILAPEFVLRLSDSKYKRVDTGKKQTVKELNESGQLVDKEVPVYEFNSELNEDYASGIAVFSATTTNGTIGHYAGILSGTDVGLPLTDPAVNGVWLGDIAWVSDDGRFVKRAYDFTLNVNLNDGSISGSGITDSLGRVPGYENTDSLSLFARWKGNGILTDGTTTLKTASGTFTGILTGMIGNAGVVGVFASNDGQAVAYAGGFFAKPPTTPAEVAAIPATATTWATNAPDVLPAGTFVRGSTSRNSSTFTTGLEDGLGLNEGTGRYEALNYSLFDTEDLKDLSEFVLRLDDAKDSAGYTSGVAFFYGNIARNSNERFVAGLLSGTEVGANLPWRTSYQGQVSAIWGGRISGNFGSYSDGEFDAISARVFPDEIILSDSTKEFTDTSFQLEINFETSTIKTPEGKGAFKNIKLRFDGSFDRNGIISGTTATTTHDSIRPRGNGVFSGIIGQDAAIGVFRSTDVRASGYVGGFIVTACAFDVFGQTCLERTNVVAITAYCTNPTANGGTNPFHTDCVQDTHGDVNAARVAACVKDADVDTADVSRCPGLIVGFCLDATSDTGSNPFNDACAPLQMDPLQTANLTIARNNACLNFGTEANILCRNRANIITECLTTDPYAYVGCNTALHINNGHRRAYCLTNDGIKDPACPNATSGDWVASITGLNTDPDTTATAKNEFLQIADKTISTMGTTLASDDAGGTEPTPTTLDFSDISYGDVSFSADDGLAYFSGYQATTLYHYAGIFGSTDLGAPITESGFSATWIGLVRINAIATPMYFTLAVTFDGTEGNDNTVDGFIANISGASDLLIAGTFAANGVLTGDVHYAEFTSETTPETPPTFNGSLSGLIGVDGAVAAFISTATGTDGYAGGFVATPPMGICKTDVFDAACPVRDIITATTAFCMNITDNLGANPFNTGCVETTHGAVDAAQRDACLSFAIFPNVACQTLSSVRTACLADPFTNIGCATRTDYDEIEDVFCDTSAGIKTADCPNATSGDWVASRTDLNTDPATTTDSTDTTRAKNEFLQIVDKTISTTGTTAGANGAASDRPIVTTLDLSEITLDGASLGLDADDGLAYFSGYQGNTLYHYAGIFATTDLGAPIAEAGFSATWPAMLSVNGMEIDFDLVLTFNGTTKTGTFTAHKGGFDFIINSSNPFHRMSLRGTFDENGVMTGQAHRGSLAQTAITAGNANGTLSGLISAEGAVAVFVGTGYSGGFVAAPSDTANFGDWTRSFDGGFNNAEALLDADAIEFVANTANFTKLSGHIPPVLNDQTLVRTTFLRLNPTEGEMGYESGLVFWHGTAGADVSKTLQYYAGLLPTTDLGAPLTDVSKNGTWTGRIDGVTNGDILDETEVKFKVIFGEATTFANSVGSIKSIANETDYTYVNDNTLGAVNVNAPNTGGDAFNNTFDFTGGFNAQGVITGTVAHTNGKPIGGGTVNGVFNGLIGVDGAVGLFKSTDGQDFGYIGGFHASPPAGN